MYEYNEYSSPSKSPQSPVQKPPPSGRPFSPIVSPTNISYHLPEEQQWLSSQDQPRDTRVFGASPRGRSSSPSPSQQNDGQKDMRVFGVKPRAQSPSPIANGSRPTTATISSATSSPTQENVERKIKIKTNKSPPLIQDNRQLSYTELNRNQSDPSKVFYAQNKRNESLYQNPGLYRPETGRPINDRRIFAKDWKHRMGGSLDNQPHWKEPLPQLKTVRPDVNQLLPSHTKRQQTYIVQTPPTEMNARPPPTGTIRRRIKPVWPPPDSSGRSIHRTGFDRGG